MNMPVLADKMIAILRRDLLTAMRYRSGFAIHVGGMVAELAAFYFLARAIGPAFHPDGVDYFPFLVVGTGFYTFLVMGVHSFLETVQEAQTTGTLEMLLTTSTPAPTLVFLSAMSAFSASAAQFLLYVGAGLLLSRGSVPVPDLQGGLVIFILSLGIAAALGMIAAAIQIAIQKGSAVSWLLGSGTWFMTGALFPVATLPQPLRVISELIPITHSVNGMRLALLQGAPFAVLSHEIVILAAFCAVLLPASVLILATCVKSARQDGTLACY